MLLFTFCLFSQNRQFFFETTFELINLYFLGPNGPKFSNKSPEIYILSFWSKYFFAYSKKKIILTIHISISQIPAHPIVQVG